MCSDAECGHLHRVIIEPSTRALTHLVIGKDSHSARLVPVSVVENAGPEEIHLLCTIEEFARFEPAEATELLERPGSGAPIVDQGRAGTVYPSAYSAARTETVTYDRIPAGEVQVTRGEPVHALDGDIGKVQGLVVDADNHVTHVLLAEGHLWGRKEVAIPIRAVADATLGVQLSLTREQVKNLPPVNVAWFG